MFTEETVFILGAGASWHYGYPTGEKLIEDVKSRAGMLKGYFQKAIQSGQLSNNPLPRYIEHLKHKSNESCQLFLKQCESLHQRLIDVNPLVIDYFLEHNTDLQDIGKMLIAFEILDSERIHKERSARSHNANINRKTNQNSNISSFNDDWCKFIISKITEGLKPSSPETILDNKVNFITFNYDTSLEHRIFQAINHISIFSEKIKSDFFGKSSFVIHLYGEVRKNGFEATSYGSLPDFNNALFRGGGKDVIKALDIAWEASKTIRTIPETKTEIAEVLEKACKLIKDAKVVYILGYGFDEMNSINLKLADSLYLSTDRAKKIYFTNYKDSNRINKRAGELFLKDENSFLKTEIPVLNATQKILAQAKRKYYEKSIRDVYGALENDFDL